ncbi:MAG: TIGR03009 domain-containing protein [Gemmataceae bacterium]
MLGLYPLVSPSLSAQTNQAGDTAPPNAATSAATSAKLDGYLQRWEQEMRRVETLSAALARIDSDKVFGSTTKYSGFAHYMKSGTGSTALNLAMLELKQDGKPEIADKFICTGTYLYQFLPAQKEIRAYEMPRPKPGQVADDSFMGFLFGMKAEEARRRYNLNLHKEDNYYIYMDISPRFQADRADFTRARLVLNKDSFLPRQLWFEHPNGNTVTWDIPRLQSGVALDRRAFDSPKVPAGWKLVPVNRSSTTGTTNGIPTSNEKQPPPRVIRPSSSNP